VALSILISLLCESGICDNKKGNSDGNG
jgi:hypothetical protein